MYLKLAFLTSSLKVFCTTFLMAKQQLFSYSTVIQTGVESCNHLRGPFKCIPLCQKYAANAFHP